MVRSALRVSLSGPRFLACILLLSFGAPGLAGAQSAKATAEDLDDTLFAEEDEGKKGKVDDEFLSLLTTMVNTTELATKVKQTLAEAPSIISVINRDQLLQRNFHTVAEALATLPGVFVNNDHAFQDVNLRGVSGELRGASRLVKIMINGQPVSFRAETTNFIGPEMIPMEAVDRIEVIRGPGSALYGANAFLGVVNIVTRSGRSLKGGLVSLGMNLFNGNPGFYVNATAGHVFGPLDVMLSVSHTRINRSGLKIRCTAAIGDETPCEYQGGAVNVFKPFIDPELRDPAPDPNDPNTQPARESLNDIAQPTSMMGTATLDLKKWGKTKLLGNLQLLDTRGSFSDWGTLNYVRDADNNADGGSANRMSLYNTTLRLEHDLPLFKKKLNIKVGTAYARGWTAGADKLREHSQTDLDEFTTRDKYGFQGLDVFGELHVFVLERKIATDDDDAEAEVPGKGKGKAKALTLAKPATKPLIQHWLSRIFFLLGADYSREQIRYVEDAPSSGEWDWGIADLGNLGVYGQAMGGFLDNRIALVFGLRYDDHMGGKVGQDIFDRLEDEDKAKLCDQEVCYDQLNFRVGTTFMLLKNVGAMEEMDSYYLDELYFKVLYGTAFKAPSPLFLYQNGYLGERPLNANPALRPQKVNSFELLAGTTMFGRRLTSAVTFFMNNLEDKAVFERAGGLGIVARNGEPVSTVGVEAELNFFWDPIGFWTNLSWQKSTLDQEIDAEADPPLIDTTVGYPGIQAWFGVNWYVKWIKTAVTIEGQYVGKRLGSGFVRNGEKYELDPYLLFNMSIVSRNWNFWGARETRVAFQIKNILDTRYDYPGYQPFYRYDVPGLPRVFWFNVSQEF